MGSVIGVVVGEGRESEREGESPDLGKEERKFFFVTTGSQLR